jgi:hypothetical protein
MKAANDTDAAPSGRNDEAYSPSSPSFRAKSAMRVALPRAWARTWRTRTRRCRRGRTGACARLATHTCTRRRGRGRTGACARLTTHTCTRRRRRSRTRACARLTTRARTTAPRAWSLCEHQRRGHDEDGEGGHHCFTQPAEHLYVLPQPAWLCSLGCSMSRVPCATCSVGTVLTRQRSNSYATSTGRPARASSSALV